jgi:hypothetical protein
MTAIKRFIICFIVLFLVYPVVALEIADFGPYTSREPGEFPNGSGPGIPPPDYGYSGDSVTLYCAVSKRGVTGKGVAPENLRVFLYWSEVTDKENRVWISPRMTEMLYSHSAGGVDWFSVKISRLGGRCYKYTTFVIDGEEHPELMGKDISEIQRIPNWTEMVHWAPTGYGNDGFLYPARPLWLYVVPAAIIVALLSFFWLRRRGEAAPIPTPAPTA